MSGFHATSTRVDKDRPYIAGEVLEAHRLVALDLANPNEVVYLDEDDDQIMVGVNPEPAESGDQINVVLEGDVLIKAAEVFPYGAILTSAADGQVKKHVPTQTDTGSFDNTATSIEKPIGYALAEADRVGELVPVRLMPTIAGTINPT